MASPEMCTFCFDVLLGHFDRRECAVPNFENGKYPLFVTWLKESRDGHKELSLRGCIGSLTPLNIHSGLRNYAITSAFKDRRFAPISQKELSRLHCAVSLLTCFEDAANYLDWEIGKHGLVIEFVDNHGQRRTATYLPDVCPEQGWTKLECIDSLIRKSGYDAAVTEALRQSLKLTRYQSTKCSMSYEDYIRASAGGNSLEQAAQRADQLIDVRA